MLSGSLRCIAILLLALCLHGCEESGRSEARSSEATISALQQAHISDINLSEVVDTFVLGSDRTDLQRDALTSRALGSVVRWELVVYNIEADGDAYRVTSDQRSPMSAVPFLVAVYVTPRGEADVQRLLKTRTGDRLQVIGKIADIRLRSMLVLSPALVRP